MTRKYNKLLFVCSLLFFTVAMTVMIAYCVKRDGTDIEGQGDGRWQDVMEESLGTVVRPDAICEKEQTDSKELLVPLTQEINEKQITVENNVMQQTLTIKIDKLPTGYFYEHKLSGNTDKMQEIAYDSDDRSTRLVIRYDEIQEVDTSFENGCLHVTFAAPGEKYDKILVIDPACGGDEAGISVEKLVEKDLTLDIVLRLKRLLDETDIKVYYTRLTDEAKTEEQVLKLVNDTKADMFLSIHGASDDTDTSLNGIKTYYNETFFIPGFSSSDFAYLVEEHVAKTTGAKALGLAAGEDAMYLVRDSQVPVAQIEIGYFSNQQERNRLSKEEYKDKIAKGLYEAILAAYEEQEMEVEK